MGLSITSASRASGALQRARSQPELLALGALLLVGLLLRVYFTIEWRPAITGYSDSGIYFQDAQTGPFADPFRTVEDLKKVKGIGDKMFESLRPNLMVSEAKK